MAVPKTKKVIAEIGFDLFWVLLIIGFIWALTS